MPRYLSRSLVILLTALAISGWATALNLGLRVLPSAGATPAEIADQASEYLHARIEFSAGTGRLEQLEPLVTGEIAATLAALEGEVIPDQMSLVGEPERQTLWRVDERALVELRYLLQRGGLNVSEGELVMMELVEGRWRASRSWPVVVDPARS
jgi:hypothetical protein